MYFSPTALARRRSQVLFVTAVRSAHRYRMIARVWHSWTKKVPKGIAENDCDECSLHPKKFSGRAHLGIFDALRTFTGPGHEHASGAERLVMPIPRLAF